jgi:hypothetical protein
VAESALDTCDWDPRRAFLFARDLAIAVKKTRHLASQAVSHPSFSNQRFPIDAVTLVGLCWFQIFSFKTRDVCFETFHCLNFLSTTNERMIHYRI